MKRIFIYFAILMILVSSIYLLLKLAYTPTVKPPVMVTSTSTIASDAVTTTTTLPFHPGFRCTELNNLTLRKQCWSMVGMRETDCDEIKHPLRLMKCVVDLAVMERDPGLCLKLNGTHVDLCHHSYSIHRLDAPTCERIISEDLSGRCVKTVGSQIRRNYCRILKGVKGDACNVERAYVTQNISICNIIFDSDIQKICMVSLNGDTSYCNDFKNAEQKRKCIESAEGLLGISYNEHGDWW